MRTQKVKSNRDPKRMGRIKTEDDVWLHPVAYPSINEFVIPKPGDYVVTWDDFYLPCGNDAFTIFVDDIVRKVSQLRNEGAPSADILDMLLGALYEYPNGEFWNGKTEEGETKTDQT